MRKILISAMLFAIGCANITAPTDNPNEVFILSETQRYANILNKDITAEVTDEIHLTESKGEMVPAAGWYKNGHIKYWRTTVREYNFPTLSALAAHEVCHSQSLKHDKLLEACENLLRWYK